MPMEVLLMSHKIIFFHCFVLGGFFLGFPPLISLFVPLLKDSFCRQVGSKPNLRFVYVQQMKCSKLVVVT